MEKEYVLIPKEDIEELCYNYLLMCAGEYGGVDNWEWWGESIDSFLESYNEANNTNFKYIEEATEDFVKSFKTIKIEE